VNAPKSIVERKPEPKKFKVGPIESDSGNHYLDILSVLIGIALLMWFKKVIGK
tara:strand:+ start:710 stop:868 length:159 start_codon:yes stop_codon:yes gene_type:complete